MTSRPRDALGRLVDAGSPAAVEPEPEAALPPPAAVARARVLLAEGRAFAAHEVLEAVWKSVDRDRARERELWRGLAQLCVGVVHAQRGNAVGAQRLLVRAAQTLEQAASPLVDVDALREWARAGAADVAAVRPQDVPL